MEQLRRAHNDAKRKLLKSIASKDDYVLDVGCGRGGDVHKWKSIGVNLFGVDPDPASIEEAKSRALNAGFNAQYSVGDIRKAPQIEFDVVCYNFSLQYIFGTPDLLDKSIKEIASRVKRDGFLVGVVPDAEKILKLECDWKDSLGNTIKRGPSIGKGTAGEMILVRLSDGPYYADGFVPEPLCHPTLLVEALGHNGFVLEKWEDFISSKTGLISDIYSIFIFRKI